MELKLVALILLTVTVLLQHSTAMPSSHVISCCTQVSNKVSKRLLKRVKNFAIQNDQMCDIRAVVLYVGQKALCAEPDNALLGRWMRKHNKKEIKLRG
uniref:C-C motif chemokine 28-like n=1 Tax=Pristiophorus japonicus TaxID=55135 RepID=UPI00398F19E4